jgi:hypothetical protein
MASGYHETRAFARLPDLDIAFIHRVDGGGGREETLLALRTVPSFAARPGLIEANPVLFWMRLSQAVCGAWLGYLTAVATSPWLIRTE